MRLGRINPRKLLNFKWILGGLSTMVGGLIIHQVIQRYVPNIYGRYGAAAIAAMLGFWYPGTKMILSATGLDDDVESFGK